ncbi:hypothetical protein LTR08_003070 [Meristemomyces frigidus]|nr:hypothetical protein LTR08_003070 [Meristemomyces frigidus]
MFKKPFLLKPAAPLRSSDRRKLADQIIDDYQLERPASDAATPEQKAEATARHTVLRNSLLPENLLSARFTTTHGPELKKAAGTVYIGSHKGEDARILWFQMEGGMYPSVYTLWGHPDLVPLLHTHEPVIKKLQGGADLMTPGLANGPPFPPQARKGVVVAIASTDRPSVPVAMGVCAIDVSELQRVQGAKGHAVENMHWVGDELWSWSTNDRPGKPPPEDIEGWARLLAGDGLAEATVDLDLDDGDEEGGVPLGEESSASAVHIEAKRRKDETSRDAPEQADAPEMTQKEIDTAFRNAFTYGVCHHKQTQPNAPNYGLVYPLSQSYVMSNLVQPFLPAFTPEQTQQLQIKKTSWKNIKKFIKSMDKEKTLKSKEKDGHETVITEIDFEAESFRTFKPYRLPKKETTTGTALGRGDKAVETIDTGDDSVGQKLQVLSYYKPTAKLQPLFTTPSTKSQLFTPPEVRELITAYIEREQLVSATNKRLVKLNPTLGNAVFDGTGALDREVLAKGSVPRDALIDRVLHAMSPAYAIQRHGSGDASAVKPKSGAPPKVHVTLETRSGSKTVTRVSGLEAYHVNARLLADELRKVCAGSTSVEALAGAAKKNEREVMEIMVQGPQREAVVKALERRGVSVRWVEVVDKTKKGKGR